MQYTYYCSEVAWGSWSRDQKVVFHIHYTTLFYSGESQHSDKFYFAFEFSQVWRRNEAGKADNQGFWYANIIELIHNR